MRELQQHASAVLPRVRAGETVGVIPGLQAATGCEVVAIASRERARAAADDLGIGAAYGSYEALLADPEVDAVYVPLPS